MTQRIVAIKAAQLLKHLRANGAVIPDETWRRWCSETYLSQVAFRESPKFPLVEPHSRAPYWIPELEAKTLCIQWGNEVMPPEDAWKTVAQFNPGRI
jgi:hypothetical protein